jgi:phosphoribosylaminoimidazole (AIR) synthetase
VFNMGIGLALIVRPGTAAALMGRIEELETLPVLLGTIGQGA